MNLNFNLALNHLFDAAAVKCVVFEFLDLFDLFIIFCTSREWYFMNKGTPLVTTIVTKNTMDIQMCTYRPAHYVYPNIPGGHDNRWNSAPVMPAKLLMNGVETKSNKHYNEHECVFLIDYLTSIAKVCGHINMPVILHMIHLAETKLKFKLDVIPGITVLDKNYHVISEDEDYTRIKKRLFRAIKVTCTNLQFLWCLCCFTGIRVNRLRQQKREARGKSKQSLSYLLVVRGPFILIV